MLKRADVVVIGSGGLGAATAFYLAKRKAGTVVLVDRHEIGSQTSPRAAGMVSCMRKGELMTRLMKVAAAAITHFTEETGQPLDWVHSGSLKVARRTEDAEVIEADNARGRRLGLDVEQITLAEAHRLNPFLETEGVTAVMRVGDDMYFDPAQVALGFARGAEARGVTLLAASKRSRRTRARSRHRWWSTPPGHGHGRSRGRAASTSRWCRRCSSSS
jgi:glycine/D-amino acid oxidase-like deaminating enzyme